MLTAVVTKLVNKKANEQEYGVSVINLSDFDYLSFINELTMEKRLEQFLLSFSESFVEQLKKQLPAPNKQLSYGFTVEAAE